MPPSDTLARMRQLASNVTFRESLGKATSVIVPFNDLGSRVPFYCVHSLSGKATDYSQLAMLLGPDQPFFAIHLPAQNRNETFGDAVDDISIPAIAGYYADALQRFQPEGPLALGGWSFGVIIAFEMAQYFRARGREVTMLVAFDLAPLNIPPDRSRLSYFFALACNVLPWMFRHKLVRQGSLGQFAAQALRKIAATATQILLRRSPHVQTDVVEKYVDPDNYPPAHVALMQKMLDAAAVYVPQRYDGKVQVYTATQEVSLAAFPKMIQDWRAIAPQSDIKAVKGTHRSMIEAPDGHAMAQHLGNLLAAARGDG